MVCHLAGDLSKNQQTAGVRPHGADECTPKIWATLDTTYFGMTKIWAFSSATWLEEAENSSLRRRLPMSLAPGPRFIFFNWERSRESPAISCLLIFFSELNTCRFVNMVLSWHAVLSWCLNLLVVERERSEVLDLQGGLDGSDESGLALQSRQSQWFLGATGGGTGNG